MVHVVLTISSKKRTRLSFSIVVSVTWWLLICCTCHRTNRMLKATTTASLVFGYVNIQPIMKKILHEKDKVNSFWNGSLDKAIMLKQVYRITATCGVSHRCDSHLRLNMMVRNIDLPEVIILYGTDLCFDESQTKLRNGLKSLLDECDETNTAVVVLTNKDVSSLSNETTISLLDTLLPKHKLILYQQTVFPPDPTDLIQCIHSIQIQPRSFGGSSGFARSQLIQPVRAPEPKHCVVIGKCVDHSRAARYVGMRVVSTTTDTNDDSLADAILLDPYEYDFGLDDISTPGSFWLNPPHPRDDEGNRVDPYTVMEFYEKMRVQNPNEEEVLRHNQHRQTECCKIQNLEDFGTKENRNYDDIDDIDIDSILADLAPLKKV